MSKNKSVTELRDEMRQLDDRAKVIMDGFQAEGRMANSAEAKELGEIQAKRYRLNLEIDEAEAMERRKGIPYGGAKGNFLACEGDLECVQPLGSARY